MLIIKVASWYIFVASVGRYGRSVGWLSSEAFIIIIYIISNGRWFLVYSLPACDIILKHARVCYVAALGHVVDLNGNRYAILILASQLTFFFFFKLFTKFSSF